MFEKYIEKDKTNLITNLQNLIRIPSVHSESKNPKYPFGEKTADALEYILNLGSTFGFKAKNLDNYCGYLEFGSSDKLIGIIGHLDVVPEGDNWDFPPFNAEIHNNKIYGRGAIDDKGPVMASLYAMKSVMEYCKENSIPINKRIRLILGLNEEKDWKCVKHYKEHEEIPSIGFSPDANFPCIYAEKGIISPYIIMDYSKYKNADIVLTKIDCNDNALNVVPEYCSCILKLQNKLIYKDVISEIFDLQKEFKFNISAEILNDNEIKIISKGIRAHSAHPELGENAISRLIIVLNKLFKNHNIGIPIFDLFEKYIGLDYNGNKLEINTPDESGQLTLNVARFEFSENDLKISLNLRIPINSTFEFVEGKFDEVCKKYNNIFYKFEGKMNPLHVSKGSYLVKTLCKIYNEETNSNLEPIPIGGATYARAFENFVSFGANLPGQKDMCHQTNEFISIDNLLIAYKIYCKAIFELLQ